MAFGGVPKVSAYAGSILKSCLRKHTGMSRRT